MISKVGDNFYGVFSNEAVTIYDIAKLLLFKLVHIFSSWLIED